MSHICGLPLLFFCSREASFPRGSPSRSDTKASQRPSGDQAGLWAFAVALVKHFASPPVAGITQIAERYACLRSSIVVATKATRRPSGDMRGLLRILN